jgi:CubicO group peptidase (beta-lactamase class C family)
VWRTLIATFVCALAVSTASAQETAAPEAQSGPPPRQLRARALEGMIQSTGDESLRQFIDLHIAPKYRDSFAPGKLLEHLRAIRAACAGFAGIMARPVGNDGLRLTFQKESGGTAVLMRIDPDQPRQIVALELLESDTAESPDAPQVAPISWDTLEKRLDEEAAKGFSGAVLVVRGGEIVLNRGYGLANRDQGIPISTETIFAIGSVPIAFTRAAILKLEEMKKLSMSDPITKYLPDVPVDKQSVSIGHLMTGKSGLPDFHHIVGVDADPDLAWIDRDTAIHRILASTLLFPPGQGQAHSHSASVLLAAIIEIVAKQPYGDFLRDQFFVPAGMTRTGNHEDGESFNDDQFAVGYEGRTAGTLNTPRYWGRTSWLVMGSGGMISTPMDLYRWIQAMSARGAKYREGGVLVGGDDRGFLCMYTEGPEDLFVLCSNSHRGPGDPASSVGHRLAELVMGR